MAYNVFKRPMFRRGGTPAQGTGIMSHVEPRVKAATGFPNFGIKNLPFSKNDQYPVNAQSPVEKQLPYIADYLEDIEPRDPLLSKYKEYKDVPRGIRNLPFAKDVYESGQKRKENSADGNADGNADGITDYTYDQEETKQQGNDIETILEQIKVQEKPSAGDKPKPTGVGKPQTKEEEIRSEAGFLKNLLEDKDMSKGEIALVLAEALATPGGFNKKLSKARALAIPLIRQRGKEDKAVKLEAYKRFKDKEEAQIKYGQPTRTSRDITEIAEAKYQQHVIDTKNKPTKNREDFRREYIVQRSKDPNVTNRQALLDSGGKPIITIIEEIRDYGRKIKQPNLKDKEKVRYQKNIQEKLDALKIWQVIPGFTETPYQQMLDEALRQGQEMKNGGRTGYSNGSPVPMPMTNSYGRVEEDTPSGVVEMEAEQVDSPTGIVGEKTVKKLSYEEIRDKLPPVINDQVVALLASSEMALGDFSAIVTQNDVNAFNIKYGVNLIVPPTTQQV